MSEVEKKIIAVVGATGAQGGGLVRAILADKSGEFTVRALTRKVDSDKAKELTALGAEVVAADLDNKESLEAAFKGVYGAFLLTNFWEHFSTEKEITQAKLLADVSKAAGLKHVIWSTLEDSRQWIPLSDDRMPTLHGKYKVPHFDGKGEVDAYFKEVDVPTTYLRTSFYFENFIFFGMGPKKDHEGNLAITLPIGDVKFPVIAVDDIGKCAYGIFKNPAHYLGKTVGVAGEHLTGQQIAEAFTKALGQPIKYNAVEPSVYRSFGFPGADDLGNMFQFNRDFADAFTSHRNLDESRALNHDLQTLEQWLAANASRIPL